MWKSSVSFYVRLALCTFIFINILRHSAATDAAIKQNFARRPSKSTSQTNILVQTAAHTVASNIISAGQFAQTDSLLYFAGSGLWSLLAKLMIK